MQPDETIVSQSNLEKAADHVLTSALRPITDVLSGDFSGLEKLAINHVIPAAGGLLALIVAYFVAKYVSRICAVPIQQRIDETLGKFAGKLVFYVIMVATIVWVISHLGYDVTSFAAILAAAGFAVGLAFQGTLSNFAAGVLLLVFRPFKVGDSVVVAGITGTVFEIDLFATAIDTADNRRVIVPNSSIAGNTIENMTYHQHRRIEVSVGIAYDSDLEASRAALTQAVEAIGDILVDGEDREAKVALSHLGPHSVDWLVRIWVATPDVSLAKELLTVSIKEHLDAAGLCIPFPQLDVHWQGNPPPSLVDSATVPFSQPTAGPNTFSVRRRAA